MGFGEIFRWGLMLQAIAIVHFIRRRPETFWLWIVLFFGGFGALAYIVMEVVPDLNLLGLFMQAFARRRRINVLEAVIRENPAVGNLEELADLLLEEREFARARALYDRVITPRTDAPDPYYRRALALIELKEYPAAVADLERVIDIDPKYDFHRAIGLLAHACALAGQPERADMLFKRALDVTTLSETELNYALFLAEQQRPAEAREHANRLLARRLTIPRYLQRRERPWFRKAKALLKRLPAA